MTASPRIIEAVITLISTRGLEETSVRTVAAEAGVSIGAVQHHFKTKADLLTAAMAAVTAAFTEELHARLAGVDDPRQALAKFCYLLSAVEDDDRAAASVWTAFAAKACVDPAIRAIHSREWALTEAFLLGLVDAAHPALPDPDLATAGLLALADGIAVARAAEDGRITSERARTLVDAALRTLQQQHGD